MSDNSSSAEEGGKFRRGRSASEPSADSHGWQLPVNASASTPSLGLSDPFLNTYTSKHSISSLKVNPSGICEETGGMTVNSDVQSSDCLNSARESAPTAATMRPSELRNSNNIQECAPLIPFEGSASSERPTSWDSRNSRAASHLAQTGQHERSATTRRNSHSLLENVSDSEGSTRLYVAKKRQMTVKLTWQWL